jgi:thiol peroxidase
MNTVGELPNIGERAPNFELVDINLQHRFLDSDYKGKTVLINIYPSLDTDVCFRSVERFIEDLKNEDVYILGVSTDTPFALYRISKKLNSNKLHLLSDAQKNNFGTHYGVTIADGPLIGFLARATLLLDADHTIIHQELVTDITKAPNYKAILDKL